MRLPAVYSKSLIGKRKRLIAQIGGLKKQLKIHK